LRLPEPDAFQFTVRLSERRYVGGAAERSRSTNSATPAFQVPAFPIASTRSKLLLKYWRAPWPGKARSNAEQVSRIRTILEALSLEIATPAEARAMLALKGGDQVAF
jgi:hypothetical protein